MIPEVKDVESPVFHKATVEGWKMQTVTFKSQYHLGDWVTAGINQSKFDDDDDNNEWRFGTEFPNAESTLHAVEYGIVGDKLLSQYESVKEEIEALDAIQEQSYMAESMRRKRKYSEEGAELDIDKFLSGQPEHWYSVTKGLQRPVVRLGVSYSMSCGNSESEFAKLGALIGVATELLCRAGFAVEVVGLHTSHGLVNKANECATVFPLKEAHETLDIQRIISPSAVGFFRYHGFVVFRNCFEGSVDGGLGHALSTSEKMKALLNLDHIIEIKWVSGGDAQRQIVDFITGIMNGKILEPSL